MNPKLEVRKTDKYGNGIFAQKSIKKNEMLFVMGGYILTIEDDNELRGKVADKGIEISDYFFIGPRKPSDLDRMPEHYVNHSCSPNAGFKGQIFMVAIKKIQPGEEITFDYAMVMYPDERSNSYFKMKCLCGSKNCRGYITEDDWELPDLQKRYNGYFQWFIQDKLDRGIIKKTASRGIQPDAYKLMPPPWEKRKSGKTGKHSFLNPKLKVRGGGRLS